MRAQSHGADEFQTAMMRPEYLCHLLADFVAEVGLEGGAGGPRVFYGRAGTMVLRQPEAERWD